MGSNVTDARPDNSMTDDHHFRRQDRGQHWRDLACHLAEHPDDLNVALANIERWLQLGRVHPGPILAWRERILAALESPAAMRGFLEFLTAPNHDSEPMKSCSPFVGIHPITTKP